MVFDKTKYIYAFVALLMPSHRIISIRWDGRIGGGHRCSGTISNWLRLEFVPRKFKLRLSMNFRTQFRSLFGALSTATLYHKYKSAFYWIYYSLLLFLFARIKFPAGTFHEWIRSFPTEYRTKAVHIWFDRTSPTLRINLLFTPFFHSSLTFSLSFIPSFFAVNSFVCECLFHRVVGV